MDTYDRLRTSRTALCVALLIWVAWRAHAVLSLPTFADPREALLLADVARVREGLPPTLFHWPGSPWTYVLAWATRLTNSTTDAAMLVVCRLLTIPFGALALAAAFRLACRVSRRPWAPSVLLATAPGFAAGEANLALVDLPALALALCAVNVAAGGVGETCHGRLAAAGLVLGVAAAVKLPVATLTPALVAAGFGTATGRRARLCMCALVCGAVAVGFALGCPFIVRDALTEGRGPVLEGLAYELGHYHRGHFGLFATAADPVQSYLTAHGAAAVWCVGIAALAVALPLVTRAPGPRHLTWLWAWAVVAIGALVVHRFSFPRHWLLACPPLFLLASAGRERLVGKWPSVARVGVVVAAVSGAAMCIGLNAREAGPSSIARCGEWMQWAADSHGVHTAPAGISPVLSWLYPPSPLADAREPATGVSAWIVAGPEARVQRAAYLTPDAFLESDFFPLTRDMFVGGPAHLSIADTSRFALVRGFGPAEAPWLPVALLGMRPPFPLNALLQPELSVHAPLDVADSLRSPD